MWTGAQRGLLWGNYYTVRNNVLNLHPWRSNDLSLGHYLKGTIIVSFRTYLYFINQDNVHIVDQLCSFQYKIACSFSLRSINVPYSYFCFWQSEEGHGRKSSSAFVRHIWSYRIVWSPSSAETSLGLLMDFKNEKKNPFEVELLVDTLSKNNFIRTSLTLIVRNCNLWQVKSNKATLGSRLPRVTFKLNWDLWIHINEVRLSLLCLLAGWHII